MKLPANTVVLAATYCDADCYLVSYHLLQYHSGIYCGTERRYGAITVVLQNGTVLPTAVLTEDMLVPDFASTRYGMARPYSTGKLLVPQLRNQLQPTSFVVQTEPGIRVLPFDFAAQTVSA